MARQKILMGLGVTAAGAVVVANRSKVAQDKGLRRVVWSAFAGFPHGRTGRVGAWVLARRHSFFAAMAEELDLQPDDDLLDVGCGAGGLLTEQASRVRYVAGVDLAPIQVRTARERLADRISAGTAEIVRGDALALPWQDGRFSVVASLDCVKFLSDPPQALREMYRVLRPGGRAVVGLGERITDQDESDTVDAWGQWRWSDTDAQRLMAEAGFVDVAVSRLQAGPKEQLVRGTRPAGGRADR